MSLSNPTHSSYIIFMIDSFTKEHFFLSNFYRTDICIDDLKFSSSESAFQSYKNLEEQSSFQPLSPSESKKKGRHVKLRDDWDDIKLSIMERILRVKFSNPILSKKLLSTGDEELIEGNYWNDTYWGVCNGVGENNLGKLLMKIREDKKNEYRK